MRWRAAADEQRINCPPLTKTREFARQSGKELLDEIIPPSDDREIAISAMMPAEGDVEIRRPRRAERT